MTVKELIEALSKFPPEMQVFVSGYEDGLTEIHKESPRKAAVHLNCQIPEYTGEHEECESKGCRHCGVDKTLGEAVLIER